MLRILLCLSSTGPTPDVVIDPVSAITSYQHYYGLLAFGFASMFLLIFGLGWAWRVFFAPSILAFITASKDIAVNQAVTAQHMAGMLETLERCLMDHLKVDREKVEREAARMSPKNNGSHGSRD